VPGCGGVGGRSLPFLAPFRDCAVLRPETQGGASEAPRSLSQGKFSGAWLRMDPMLAALRTPRLERLVVGTMARKGAERSQRGRGGEGLISRDADARTTRNRGIDDDRSVADDRAQGWPHATGAANRHPTRRSPEGYRNRQGEPSGPIQFGRIGYRRRCARERSLHRARGLERSVLTCLTHQAPNGVRPRQE